VLYIYPRTGVPGVDLPPGWDDIPGRARLHAAIVRLSRPFCRPEGAGRTQVFGLSTQDTDYQREAAERLHLPFPDPVGRGTRFRHALHLPMFMPAGMTLLAKRMAMVIDDGTIVKGVLSGVSARQERRGGRCLAARGIVRRSLANTVLAAKWRAMKSLKTFTLAESCGCRIDGVDRRFGQSIFGAAPVPAPASRSSRKKSMGP
jgi:peroxiredoxin